MSLDTVPLNDAARRLIIREALEDKGNPPWTLSDLTNESDEDGSLRKTKLASMTKNDAVYDLWVVNERVVVTCDQRWSEGTHWYLLLPAWASYHIEVVAHVLVDFVKTTYGRFSPEGVEEQTDFTS